MKATHTDYKHPRHLRVEHNENDGSGGVWCVAPSASIYAKLNKPGLPSFKGQPVPPPIVMDYKPICPSLTR